MTGTRRQFTSLAAESQGKLLATQLAATQLVSKKDIRVFPEPFLLLLFAVGPVL
jgi:hypothetical protein